MKPSWLMQPIPALGLPKEEELQEGNWIAEEKVAGWRIQIITDHGDVQIWTKNIRRKNSNITKWAGLVNIIFELKKLPSCHIDASLSIPFLDRSKASNALSTLRKHAHITRHKDYPDLKPEIWAFDLISMASSPLAARRAYLQKIIEDSFREYSRVYIVPANIVYSYENINDMFDHPRQFGNSDILLKNLNSLYEINPEGPTVSKNWVKVKSKIEEEQPND